jgi:hypothetical protein
VSDDGSYSDAGEDLDAASSSVERATDDEEEEQEVEDTAFLQGGKRPRPCTNSPRCPGGPGPRAPADTHEKACSASQPTSASLAPAATWWGAFPHRHCRSS